jgi:pimeloyl-ACP methyl ester carboxylesterase
MSIEDIQLTVGDDSYPGRLARPEQANGAGIVVRPGANHGPYGDVFDEFAGAATDEGYHVLRFESWETTEDIDVKTQAEIHAETDAAIEFLEDRGCDTVHVVAKSFGGAVTLTGAPDAAGRLVLWAPAAPFVEDANLATRRTTPLRELDFAEVDADALGGVEAPTLVLHGDEDEVPLENSEDIVDALPDAELVVLEGGDHSFQGVESETVERTLDFLSGG